MFAVTACNIPAGRFAELSAESKGEALAMAGRLSAEHKRVAFDVAKICGDGAYVFAVFLNGERRFTAIDERGGGQY